MCFRLSYESVLGNLPIAHQPRPSLASTPQHLGHHFCIAQLLQWSKISNNMIEFSLGTIAWVGVIALQAYIHFVALPRQRLHLEDDRRVENEIRKSIERNGVCNASTYQRSGYTQEDLAILASVDSSDEEDCGSCSGSSTSSPRRSQPTTVTGPQHFRPRQRGTGPGSDPDENKDLDPIDDGQEDSRLELLKYYYSTDTPPSNPPVVVISSLEEDPDPSKSKSKSKTTSSSNFSAQTVLHGDRETAANSAFHRRSNAADTRRSKRHVAFALDVCANST